MWSVVQQTYFQPQFAHRRFCKWNTQKSFEFSQVSFESLAADTPPSNTNDWVPVVGCGDLYDRVNAKRKQYERKFHFLSHESFP